MAQSNFEERIDTYEIESTNVMTGDRDRSRYLYYQLKMSMAKAKQIDIIVSFLMESGVRMFLNDMKRALERGVKIRILTGNYLGITQPSALYLIKSELSDRVDLRLYNETSRSFHPKSYIFHYESSNEIYIGSSNISKSALTSGIEWNYRFSDTLDKKNYELFYATFEDLFLNHSIIIDDEELSLETIQSLDILRPFGPGFVFPSFEIIQPKIKSLYDFQNHKHRKYTLESGLQCMRFNQSEVEYKKSVNAIYSFIGTVQINQYQGRKQVNFVIDEIVYA